MNTDPISNQRYRHILRYLHEFRSLLHLDRKTHREKEAGRSLKETISAWLGEYYSLNQLNIDYSVLLEGYNRGKEEFSKKHPNFEFIYFDECSDKNIEYALNHELNSNAIRTLLEESKRHFGYSDDHVNPYSVLRYTREFIISRALAYVQDYAHKRRLRLNWSSASHDYLTIYKWISCITRVPKSYIQAVYISILSLFILEREVGKRYPYDATHSESLLYMSIFNLHALSNKLCTIYAGFDVRGPKQLERYCSNTMGELPWVNRLAYKLLPMLYAERYIGKAFLLRFDEEHILYVARSRIQLIITGLRTDSIPGNDLEDSLMIGNRALTSSLSISNFYLQSDILNVDEEGNVQRIPWVRDPNVVLGKNFH